MTTLSFAAGLDSLRFQCRLREIAFFEPTSAEDRVARIAAAIEALPSGRYLVGLGPNCGETIRIGAHPIRLGRHASILEQSTDEVVDYSINDASIVGPREVSRLHATLDATKCSSDEVKLHDEQSTTGTWLYPEMTRVPSDSPATLQHGSLFSLGPTGTNLFVLIVRG